MPKKGISSSKFHAVNFRLNRDLEFDKQLSDRINQDLKDGVNVSQLIKALLFAHYLIQQEAEKVV